MQITFLTIYLDDTDFGLANAQWDLLSMWQAAISNNTIKIIAEAKINFKNYSLPEYPDQEKLTKEINYKTSYHLNDGQFWLALGKRYDTFEELYNDLAKTHRLMELVITVEDY